MKEIIFSFILYMLYDAYMRQRDKEKFATKADLAALTGTGARTINQITQTADLSEFNARLARLEQSPYA